MSALTRMSLFIIARAVLCLALVAWIVGQWWFVDVQILASGSHAVVSVFRADWCLTHVPTGAAGAAWSAEIYPVQVPDKGASPSTTAMTISTDKRRRSMFEQIVLGGGRSPGLTQSVYTWKLFGVAYFECRAVETIFASHWLIVCVCAVFNASLYCIYRKRHHRATRHD